MVEFLRKSESRGNKIARGDSIRITKIHQFTLILNSVAVRYDVDIFKLTARAQPIYREVYART